jgi:glycerol-3-phosphate dehydrogenase
MFVITARDLLNGHQYDVRARVIVNAAGPWAGPFLRRCKVEMRWPMLKAMNLVTSRPAARAALVSPGRNGRALVALPWQGRTLIGTSESTDERAADDQAAIGSEVDRFLGEINETFRGLDLHAHEITLVHRGVVPAAARDGRLSLLSHSRIVDHAQTGLSGLISIVGVKYTTARAVSERAVDLVLQKLGRPAAPSRTATVTLPGAAITDRESDDPAGHAVRSEMAQTLTDLLVRRTGLGAAGYPGDAVAVAHADLMQRALGWSDERKQREIDALKHFYDLA